MEYFQSARTVRLRTHSNKYMVAGEDGQGVKQSRNGQSSKARWKVEISPAGGGGKMVRLVSCHGKYLTATDEPFLLGVTGRKVAQSTPASENEVAIDWEPIRVGFEIKMRARGGGGGGGMTYKFLKANRGPPPYKDSVTVDSVSRASPRVMWTVDVLETVGGGGGGVVKVAGDEDRRLVSCGTAATSRCSGSGSEESSLGMTEDDEDDDYSVCDDEMASSFASLSLNQPSYRGPQNGMELFHNAKTVRLKSHHDKYLLADEGHDSVSQNRHRAGSRRARWTVEYVTTTEGVKKVRLRSVFDKHLMATDEPCFMGMTGKKVVQRRVSRPDSSVEWEPIREGMQLKLKSRYGNFLRANGGVPPWRNSITHDVPSRGHAKHWILWDIDVLAVYEEEKKKPTTTTVADDDVPKNVGDGDDPTHAEEKEAKVEEDVSSHEDGEEENEVEEEEDDEDEPFSFTADWMRTKASQLGTSSEPKNEGRLIHYNLVDDDGNIIEGSGGGGIELYFKGSTLNDLKQRLEEETGLEDVLICSRNPLNGKLNPLRLALPPHHVKMHVFVVPPSSKCGFGFTCGRGAGRGIRSVVVVVAQRLCPSSYHILLLRCYWGWKEHWCVCVCVCAYIIHHISW